MTIREPDPAVEMKLGRDDELASGRQEAERKRQWSYRFLFKKTQNELV